MTRNQIFGSAIGGIIVFMAIGSLFSDNDQRYRNDDDDHRGYNVNIEVDVDGDEIVIKTIGGETVVFTKDGKIECESGQDSISVARDDGSVTIIACD